MLLPDSQLQSELTNKKKACAQCPWRKSNQGKRHKRGFYTKRNLTRLWNQIRRGGGAQSCHLTDPSHPDHIEAGASEKSEAQECPGSVLVVLREMQVMAGDDNRIGEGDTERYLKERKKRGLTKQGILYWVIQRYLHGGVPFIGGPKLPEVADDPDVGLPDYLAEG